MNYRREIDGLRAIAVLSVIVFHCGFGFSGGGFVGVDVFFVISGYLITGILAHDIDRGRFSILDFYERRARRIIPALYVLIFIVSALLTVLMLPAQLKDYGQSVVSTVLFSSNIYFYLKTDYWAQSSEFLPLLHTWSLGVEEQFYLFFPPLLFLLWRLGERFVFYFVLFFVSLSVVVSEVVGVGGAASFYLIPARAWELLVGSIAALWVRRRGTQKNELLAWVGVIAIILPVFLYNKSTPFPGLFALIPVGGAFLFMIFATGETRVGRFLSIKIFVGVGLVSYSAYLWHQPILAILRISNSSVDLSLFEKIFAVFFSFFMAYFSYRYIEAPFRDRKNFSRNFIFLLSVFPLIFFVVYGLGMHFSEGLRDLKLSMLPPQVKSMMVKLENEYAMRTRWWNESLKRAQAPYVESGKIKLLYLGDSLSEDLYVVSLKSDLMKEKFEVRRIPFDDECAKHILTKGAEINHNLRPCSEALVDDFQSDIFKKSDIVVLASAWLSNSKYLEALLGRGELYGKRIIVYKSHSFSHISSIIMSLSGSGWSISDRRFQEFVYLNKDARTMIANSELEQISKSHNILTIDGFEAFCSSDGLCNMFNEDGASYIIDKAHLSMSGVSFFSEWFVGKMLGMLESK